MDNKNIFMELAEEMEKELGDWENSEGLSEERLQKIIEIAEERFKNEKS